MLSMRKKHDQDQSINLTWLDVTMNDFVHVAVTDSHEELIKQRFCCSFCKTTLIHVKVGSEIPISRVCNQAAIVCKRFKVKVQAPYINA
jgi:hypothetical protein